MSTTPFYDSLIQSMPEGLPRQVYSVLSRHVGEGSKITLPALVDAVFGPCPTVLDAGQRKTWYSTRERQVRETIETLRRDKRIPILSESGKSGRWIAADREELNACLNELRARHTSLGDMIRSLSQAIVPGNEPEFKQPAKQVGLWR